MSRRDKPSPLRIPRRLIYTALPIAVAGALGCGPDTTLARDAGAPDLRDATADLRSTPPDGCALPVSCAPITPGAQCGGVFCNLNDCPSGCEPYV
jgi:hypothetical protein